MVYVTDGTYVYVGLVLSNLAFAISEFPPLTTPALNNVAVCFERLFGAGDGNRTHIASLGS